MAHLLSFIVIVLLTINFLLFVSGDADVLVRLESYSNPDGTDERGRCCDGWPLMCRFGCDYYFKLCLDEPRKSNRTKHCTYGGYHTGYDEAFKNKRDVIFTEEIGSQSNPFHFSIDRTINMMTTFKIEIMDKDRLSSNDRVDFLRKDVWLHKGIFEEIQIPLHLVGRTRLYASVALKCSTNWYGEDCDTYCAPPGETDHYTCSTFGIPICEPGWTGPLCNHR